MSGIAAGYGDVLQAVRDLTVQLSPDERAALFAGTATSIYGLRQAASQAS